jgi:hypothetical protein
VAAAHFDGCSGVSLLPSAALGAAKIRIMGGADVTNQTALYPGVTVKPGAVLGVFTYAEAGRTFPRNSITQVSAAAVHQQAADNMSNNGAGFSFHLFLGSGSDRHISSTNHACTPWSHQAVLHNTC